MHEIELAERVLARFRLIVRVGSFGALVWLIWGKATESNGDSRQNGTPLFSARDGRAGGAVEQRCGIHMPTFQVEFWSHPQFVMRSILVLLQILFKSPPIPAACHIQFVMRTWSGYLPPRRNRSQQSISFNIWDGGIKRHWGWLRIFWESRPRCRLRCFAVSSTCPQQSEVSCYSVDPCIW
jgi:hypothetical protein